MIKLNTFSYNQKKYNTPNFGAKSPSKKTAKSVADIATEEVQKAMSNMETLRTLN